MSSRAHSLRAFEFTVSRFFEAGSRPCYMWTFTLPVAMDVRVARSRWASLQRELVRQFHFCGVRVFELHERHGLHVHVIACGRYPIRPLRHVARLLGWGRIHVTGKIKNHAQAMYVAKYLSKQDRPLCFSGVRVWAVIGQEYLRGATVSLDRRGRKRVSGGCTSVRHVSCDSLRSRACRFARDYWGLRGVKILQASPDIVHAAIRSGDDLRGACAGVQTFFASNWGSLPFLRELSQRNKAGSGYGVAVSAPAHNLVIHQTTTNRTKCA